MHRLITAIGMMATVCFALGCGSSGGETASPSVTQTQFIRQAETVCAKIAKEQEGALIAWRKQFSGGVTEAEEHLEDGFRKVIIPSMRRQAKELGRIPVPEEDQGKVAQMTQSLLEASKALEENGPEQVPHSLIYAFKRAAFAYGLKTCPVL